MPAQEKAMVEYRQTTAIALLISQIILIILYAALVVTELDAVQSETSNTLLFLQEIKNVVLFKQRRNRFQTDRRNVTTAVLFTDRDDEETKKRGHFITSSKIQSR